MNKAFRPLCAVILLLVLTAVPSLTVSAAAQTAKITVGNTPISATGGSTISMPIGLEAVGADITRIAGISLSVSYDKTKLTYIDSPVVSSILELSSTTLYHNEASALVNLAWSGSSSVQIAAKATLYTMTFRVLGGVTGSTNINVKVNELYDASGSGSNISYDDISISGANPAVKAINISENNDPMVKAAYDAIEAIGTVTYTGECLQKINYAAYRYSLLTNVQKALVSNYQKLFNAQVKYDELKHEASKKPVDEEISNYINKHSRVLSLAVENVSLTDETDINTAYDDFQKLSAAAKNEIFSYNIKLKNMKTRITALKKAEEDRKKAEEEERLQREEAQDYADGFKKTYTAFLKLKESDMLPDHYAGLNQALSSLNMLSGLNPYVGDFLSAERIILENLMEKVEALIEEQGEGPTPSELAADKYRTANSWLLSQTEKSITADDKVDILVAMEVYGILEPDVQTMLSKEYDLLNKLLTRATYLASQNADVTEPDPDHTESDTSETTASDTDNTDSTTESTNHSETTIPTGVDRDDDNKSASGSIKGKGSIAVPIVTMIFVVSLVLFEGLQAYYHLYYKKKIIMK